MPLLFFSFLFSLLLPCLCEAIPYTAIEISKQHVALLEASFYRLSIPCSLPCQEHVALLETSIEAWEQVLCVCVCARARAPDAALNTPSPPTQHALECVGGVCVCVCVCVGEGGERESKREGEREGGGDEGVEGRGREGGRWARSKPLQLEYSCKFPINIQIGEVYSNSTRVYDMTLFIAIPCFFLF